MTPFTAWWRVKPVGPSVLAPAAAGTMRAIPGTRCLLRARAMFAIRVCRGSLRECGWGGITGMSCAGAPFMREARVMAGSGPERERFDVTLSTSPFPPQWMSDTINNIGIDSVLVRSGPLTIPRGPCMCRRRGPTRTGGSSSSPSRLCIRAARSA